MLGLRRRRSASKMISNRQTDRQTEGTFTYSSCDVPCSHNLPFVRVKSPAHRHRRSIYGHGTSCGSSLSQSPSLGYNHKHPTSLDSVRARSLARSHKTCLAISVRVSGALGTHNAEMVTELLLLRSRGYSNGTARVEAMHMWRTVRAAGR